MHEHVPHTRTHYREKPVLTVQRLFTCIRTLLRLLWPPVETRDAESRLAFFLWRVFQKTTWRIYRRAVLFFSFVFFALLSRRWKQSSSIGSDVCVCMRHTVYVCVSAKKKKIIEASFTRDSHRALRWRLLAHKHLLTYWQRGEGVGGVTLSHIHGFHNYIHTSQTRKHRQRGERERERERERGREWGGRGGGWTPPPVWGWKILRRHWNGSDSSSSLLPRFPEMDGWVADITSGDGGQMKGFLDVPRLG